MKNNDADIYVAITLAHQIIPNIWPHTLITVQLRTLLTFDVSVIILLYPEVGNLGWICHRLRPILDLKPYICISFPSIKPDYLLIEMFVNTKQDVTMPLV